MPHSVAELLPSLPSLPWLPTRPVVGDSTPPVLSTNVNYGGSGRIFGTVKFVGDPTNVPTRRRVVLLAERDGACVGERWSDAVTGAYEFANINAALRYTVAAYDYAGAFRIVLADNLLPVPM